MTRSRACKRLARARLALSPGTEGAAWRFRVRDGLAGGLAVPRCVIVLVQARALQARTGMVHAMPVDTVRGAPIAWHVPKSLSRQGAAIAVARAPHWPAGVRASPLPWHTAHPFFSHPSHSHRFLIPLALAGHGASSARRAWSGRGAIAGASPFRPRASSCMPHVPWRIRPTMSHASPIHSHTSARGLRELPPLPHGGRGGLATCALFHSLVHSPCMFHAAPPPAPPFRSARGRSPRNIVDDETDDAPRRDAWSADSPRDGSPEPSRFALCGRCRWPPSPSSVRSDFSHARRVFR